MLGFFLTTLTTAVSLLAVSLVTPGVVVTTFWAAMFAAVSIGFVNGWIKPILFILSLPVNILTLGLFSLVINGVCFWLASLLVPGFAVHGFLALTFGPMILSAVNAFLGRYLAEKGIGQPTPLVSESYVVIESAE